MTKTKTKTPAYTTTGSVRGGCGHRHRTADAALDCLRADQSGCARQGGYSDRRIVALDGAAEVEVVDGYLTDVEDTCYCAGCGCDVVAATVALRGGQPLCEGCL